MTQLMAVDPAVFPCIAYYYEKQCNELMAIKAFVVANCTLDDAFGLLLTIMKPQYEEARDKTMGAMDCVSDMLQDLAGKVADYVDFIEEQEEKNCKELSDLEARVTQLEAEVAAGKASGSGGGGFGGGGGGSFGGGGGGGNYSGGSGDVTGGVDPGDDTSNDGDDTSNDGDDDGDTTINITIDGDDNTITINDDGDVTVTPDDDGTPVDTTQPDTDTIDESTMSEPFTMDQPARESGGGAVLDPDVAVLDPDVVAAENAEQAKFYDQLWEEQAAKDPMGRSADELRQAWESREPIELSLSTDNAVGYAAPTVEPIPVDFSLFSSANVSSNALIGARS